MREKLWKKIERVIANDDEYSLRSAGTTAVDDEYGFEILLKKNSGDVGRPEPMEEEKPKREPLRCKLGVHVYGRWGNVEPTLFGAIAGRGIQTRECVLCKRVDKREL